MNILLNVLFPQRISRIQYAVRYFTLLFVMVFSSVLMRLSDHIHSAPLSIGLILFSMGVLIFSLVCLFRSILIPRIRDIGLHGAFALLVLVPFINFLFVFALLFIPGNAFNKATIPAGQDDGVNDPQNGQFREGTRD